MKFLMWDTETFNLFGDDQDISNCGISCSVTSRLEGNKIKGTHIAHDGIGKRASKKFCVNVVNSLYDHRKQGYTIVTHNGAQFDFKLLAQESGMVEECKALALHSIDTLLYIYSQTGYFVSLANLALGMQVVVEKEDKATLSTGKEIKMGGELFPALWKAGEFEAIKPYAEKDVQSLGAIVYKWLANDTIRWKLPWGGWKKLRNSPVASVEWCIHNSKHLSSSKGFKSGHTSNLLEWNL